MTTKIGDLWERPRYRHVTQIVAALVLVVGLAAVLIQHNRVNDTHFNADPNPSPFAKDGAVIPVPPAAVASAQAFIHDAVLRQNLAKSWDESTTKMHGGLTRKQWLTGTIPVTPFPAGTVFSKGKVVESRQHRVWFEMLVQHTSAKDETADGAGGLFFAQLVPRDGGWAMNYWGAKGWNPPVPANGGQ